MAGELLQQLERDPLSKGGDAKSAFQAEKPISEYRAVLTDSDIAPTTAHRWQTVATVPDEVFEEHVAEVKQEQREAWTKAVELLQQLERDKGGRPVENSSQPVTSSEYSAVLEDNDINRMTAHRWQVKRY